MKLKRLIYFSALLVLVLLVSFSLTFRKPRVQAESPLRTHENIENLLIAVAPFSTTKLPASQGAQVQEKIARHMEKDLGFRVLRVSQPVSLGPPGQPDLQTGFSNADKIISQTGADLLIWGEEDDRAKILDLVPQWDAYVSTSLRAQSMAKQAGYSLHATSSLRALSEGQALQALEWVTASWRGLIQASEGMDISKTVKSLIPKMDTVLGLTQYKGWDPFTQTEVERNLAFLMAYYGGETGDVPSLEGAARLSRDVFSKLPPINSETRASQDYLDCSFALGNSLYQLGNSQPGGQDFAESVTVFQRALRMTSPREDPDNWARIQMMLGRSLAGLGARQGDAATITKAMGAFEKAAKKTSRYGRLHSWVIVQEGLGGCCEELAQLDPKDVGDVRKAIGHYLLAETPDCKVEAPADYARLEINLAMAYLSLGRKTESVRDLGESIRHSNGAKEMLEQMGNPRYLGLILRTLGQAQLFSAFYTSNDAFLSQAEDSLKQAQNLVPQAQDPASWRECQDNLGLLEGLRGEKKYDQALFQSARDIEGKLARDYLRDGQKPKWIEMTGTRCEIELMMGNASCGTRLEDAALKTLEALRPQVDARKSPVQYVELNSTMAEALDQKGGKEKDPVDFQKAVSLLEEALGPVGEGTDESTHRSLRSGLAGAYAGLLRFKSDPALLAKAKALAGELGKELDTPPSPQERGIHLLNGARLEGAVSNLEKDKDRLARARRYALSAEKLFGKNGYVFYAGEAHEELGNLDLEEGLWSGDQGLLQEARDEFEAAREILKDYGDCREKELSGKILESGK